MYYYKNYLEAVEPKLTVGGCFAAHNISEGMPMEGFGRGGGAGFRRGFGRGFGGRGGFGVGDFLEYARSFSNLETKVLELSGSHGLSVSYKTGEK